jgi:D-alanyl-lipoteichoic acid acyltransferase DltB (MBOAT superfamily)
LIERRKNLQFETLNLKWRAKFWLIANIVINLGILAIFKYYDFFVSEFGAMFGISTESLLLRIILPVGISFYTFQALSYSIDVYRKKIEPTRDIVAFFAYVAFFPQLVAGPIERATNLLPQFLQKRTFKYEQGIDGMRQILWGLFKKIVIADNCAMYVDQVWSTYDRYPERKHLAIGSHPLYVPDIWRFLRLLGYRYRYSETLWYQTDAELQQSLFQPGYCGVLEKVASLAYLMVPRLRLYPDGW